MASPRENFSLSGPLHLTAVNWKDPNHRRSVAASLVQGVYILERDRQQKRQGPQALARPWWDFFHFQLVRVLVDNADLSIFGAIYEFKFPASYCYGMAPNPPRFVIAFRGTIPKPDTRSQDLKLDLQFICNRLQQSSRFQLAMQEVQNMAAVAGAANIWLAGHSLGSAIALLAGKKMVKTGCPIETYLFNSPFISAPIEQFKNHKVKHGIRITSSVIKAGVAVALKGHQQRRQENDTFVVLSAWVPNLFVNPSDPICSEYIGYFQHREKMVKLGAGEIERLATQNSIGSLFSSGKASESLHLLPSANLTINLSSYEDFKQAHGIHQWWRPNLYSQSNLHQFSCNSFCPQLHNGNG
ncbi:GDSL esterase/lipase At4g10955-like [Cornus florida]|uniref:GDSL esterase/lipase At4g10955-like n=1 Tax=Cornus florida TaxID=4283 RepID=UPI00289F335E|nr:GDSL esterase/lipase At4g10955-like [Cornus florida]XP_059667228.1 GDSL esterase/lipase At4g10955-like [Cornus florida]